MKKAIVLLMTLGFISIISALVLWSLNISKDRFDKIVYIDAENQFGIVFKDFIKIINQNTKEINSSERLDAFLSIGMPAIAEAKTKVGLGFIVESKMDKININYILSTLVAHEANVTRNEDDDYLIRPLVKYFRDKHELSNPDLMFDFLLDSIDKDDMERGTETEIANEDIDFEQGKIYSFNHLKKIFNKYYQESRDKRVFNIKRSEFEEYFYFGDTDRGMFDIGRCEFGCKAMELLIDDEFTIDEDTDFIEIFKDRAKDDPEMDETLKKIKKIYNISQFNIKSKYLVKCIVTFDTSEYRRDISFDYDIGSGGVENIDKNFQEEE